MSAAGRAPPPTSSLPAGPTYRSPCSTSIRCCWHWPTRPCRPLPARSAPTSPRRAGASLAGGPFDLVLAIMTVHYLPEQHLRNWYAEAQQMLHAHGLLLVADIIPDDPPPPSRPRQQGGGEDPWTDWWQQLGGHRALEPLLRQRATALAGLTSAEFVAPVRWHRKAASRAGFSSAVAVWRQGRFWPCRRPRACRDRRLLELHGRHGRVLRRPPVPRPAGWCRSQGGGRRSP